MQEEHIPDFIRYYRDKLEDRGYKELTLLAREYLDKVRDFQTTAYPMQQHHLHMGNKFFGERKKLRPDDTLQQIKQDFEGKALELAKQHGYKEQDTLKAPNNKALDREALKQHYKQQIQDALQQDRRKGKGRSL